MKKAIFFVMVFLGCLVVLTGCRKDDMAGGIMLTTERFILDGMKTSVVGDEVHWVDGDAVRINGQAGTVEVSGSTARAVGFESLTGAIRGYYPASIITATGAANEGTDNPTVVFPHRFASSFSGGRQILGLPMVGRANDGATEILFKHLSAAVNVRVKNSTGREKLYLDSVVIASADQQLCGAATVTLSSADAPAVSGASNVEANRSVVVYFDEPVLISGDYLQVQVPILPVAGGELTFKVYTHALMSDIYPGVAPAHYSYNYSRALSNNALGRNVLGVAQIAVTGASSYVTEVNRGLFTINSSGNKVRFSQGNLQYDIAQDKWSFAVQQYVTIESDGQNVGLDYAGQNIVSLFGWGTSGFDNGNQYNKPYNTDRNTSLFGYGYGPTDGNGLTGANANSDWGVYNSISNGGNEPGIWRVLQSGANNANFEWYYMLMNRPVVNSLGANRKWTMTTIGGEYKGVIIFPDTYSHPECDFVGVTYNGYSNFTSSVSVSGWKKMEAAGAVFLPAAGYRNYNRTVSNVGVECRYWSNAQGGNNYAMAARFAKDAFSTASTWSKNTGCSVRLVQDM